MKSQLLVWGARQMMNLSGWSSVTSTAHPIRLYNSQLQIDFHMNFLSVYLIEDVTDLCTELLSQILEILLGLDTGFRV